MDEVACLLDDGAVFGCAGDGDAAAAAEYGAADSEIPGLAVRTPEAEPPW